MRQREERGLVELVFLRACGRPAGLESTSVKLEVALKAGKPAPIGQPKSEFDRQPCPLSRKSKAAQEQDQGTGRLGT